MDLEILLWCVVALLVAAPAGVVVARRASTSVFVYAITLGVSAVALISAVWFLLANQGATHTLRLPLGLPWLGAHIRLDPLAAAFLVVVNLGGAAASLYGLGYGRHESDPRRVVPFFAAFLAGMNLVVLADDAIDKLVAAGSVLADSRRPIVDSAVSIAVQDGAPRPDISTGDALRESVLAARSVGYSTGPSGTALLKLFERWGVREALADRLVQAPAGVPVGSLVAQGSVELGFQQYSELMHVDGIDVLGDMPPGFEIITTFTGAVVAKSSNAAAVSDLLDFMTGADTATLKRERGMRVPAKPHAS